MSKWFEKHGTTSDWVGIGVGILVAIFTILLFIQTQKSTGAAIAAANDADSTYQLSKRQFDSTIAQNTRNDSLQYEKDIDAATEATKNAIEGQMRYREQLALQQKTTQAQIDAFQRQEQRFQTENEPRLSASNFTLIVDSITLIPEVRFSVINNNRQSVNIFSTRFNAVYINKITQGVTTKEADSILYSAKEKPYSDIIGTDPNYESYPADYPLPPAVYASILIKQSAILFVGEIGYINPINGRKLYYKFGIYTNNIGTVNFKWVFNKNF